MNRERGRSTPRLRVVAAMLAGSGLLSGCVELPRSGPVVTASDAAALPVPGPMYIDPLPPRSDDSPAQIVKGFLDAMLATPVQTKAARAFLTPEARDSWDPQRETITFADAAPPRSRDAGSADVSSTDTDDSTEKVTVSLGGVHRIDARGAWQGDLGDEDVSFTVAQLDGEYRISQLPDALVVPEQWYRQRFQQVALYFFDPTGSILVPEPVFVPDGRQLASTLVRGLLAGPPDASADLSRSYFPDGLSAGLSVPVSADGVADVALTGADIPPDAEQAELLLAQLTTTLRQDPSVRSVRVSIDGEPLALRDEPARVGLARGGAYAPYLTQSDSLLYGVRAGRLVAGTAAALAPVDGPFGTSALGVRAIVPDLTAARAAAVSADGTALLVGPVRESGTVEQVLSGATDLVPPVWDFAGRMWTVDRTASGARVLQRRVDATREVDVAGITGQDVRSLLVSRDGSRLVAVVRSPVAADGDAVVVSRVLHDDRGRVLGATPAIRIDDDIATGNRIRDIAWRSPTSVAVLGDLDDQLFAVSTLAVDGAPGRTDNRTTTVSGDLDDLAGSPAPGQPAYAVGPGVLAPLSGRGEGRIALPADLSGLVYPGG